MWLGHREQVAFLANKVGGQAGSLRLRAGVTEMMAPLNRGGLDRNGGISVCGWGWIWGMVPMRSWK